MTRKVVEPASGSRAVATDRSRSALPLFTMAVRRHRHRRQPAGRNRLGRRGAEGRFLPVLHRRDHRRGERRQHGHGVLPKATRASCSPTGVRLRQVMSVVIPTDDLCRAGAVHRHLRRLDAADRRLHEMARRLRVGTDVIAIAIGVPVIFYVMFEKWFLVPLPKGPLEELLGSEPVRRTKIAPSPGAIARGGLGVGNGRNRQSVSRLRRRTAAATICC